MSIKMIKSSEYKDGEYASSASMSWHADLEANYSDLLATAEKSFSTKKMFLKCLDDALKISLIEFCNANIKDTDKKMSDEEIENIAGNHFPAEKLRRDFHKFIDQDEKPSVSPDKSEVFFNEG